MFGYHFYEIVFIFLFWGITGWLIEVVDMRIEAGELQNRGFLHMPLCPLYGLGMLMMCMLFRNNRSSYFMLFVFGMAVGALIEYIVGWMLESIFSTKWWDYSHMRFQIRGRVCLRNTLLFGFGAIITIGYIQPVLEHMIGRIPVTAGIAITYTAVVVLAIDTVTSVFRAMKYKQKSENGEIYRIFKPHR